MSSKYWADELAEKAMARHGEPYVVSDWKTPSGRIHVGALRGVLLHDAVARALRNKGQQVRYVYGFDDIDPFDKVPKYLNQEAYAPYLGKPMVTLPAPDEHGMPLSEVTETSNYARFYADEFEETYRNLGVESETLRSATLYRTGAFNDAIRLALDHAEEIRAAYEAASEHRSADRATKQVAPNFALDVICESCGRISSTEVTAWDGTNVTYVCHDGVVPYVGGCGHEGSVSPFDGHAKLSWKVEWAAKWFILKSDVEGAGKDHYTAGGSRDVASEVFKRVYLPELDADHAKLLEDLFYEWFYIGGKKMSTSKGVGASAYEVAQQVPGELLRFLMVRTKPKSGVDFDPTFDAISRLFDEYDRILKLALTESDGNEVAIMRASAIEDKTLPGYVMRFSKLNTLVTTAAKPDEYIQLLAETEKGSALSEDERVELDRRIAFSREWASSHHEEQVVPESTEQSDTQRAFLAALVERLQSVTDEQWNAESLPNEVFEVRKSTDISSKEAFQAIYRALLGADAGPRVGDLFVQRGREAILAELSKAA